MSSNSKQPYESKTVTVYQQKLDFKQVPILYKNKYTKTLTDYKGQGFLSIRNKLCQQRGNELVKVTEIIFQNKVLTIEDRFSQGEKYLMCNPDQKIEYSSADLKAETQKKAQDQKKKKTFEKNLKKSDSLFGNIIHLYVSWLNCFANFQIEYREIHKILHQAPNYNKTLIKRMLQKPMISDTFFFFLDSSSDQIMNQIKSRDQNELKIVIQELRKLFTQKIKISDSLILSYLNEMSPSENEELKQDCIFQEQQFNPQNQQQEDEPRIQTRSSYSKKRIIRKISKKELILKEQKNTEKHDRDKYPQDP